MKMTRINHVLSFIVCMVLIAAMALFTIGCNDNKTAENVSSAPTASANIIRLGTGDVSFKLTVTDADGNASLYEINTDKATVGEALLELEVIDGEQGDYGLYIKTVQGETLDFETDGKYWAFYENGEYANAGVDQTQINANSKYELRAE